MAITSCGHAELLVHILAVELGMEVEDVEAAILNSIAHQFYAIKCLPGNASRDTLEDIIRADIKGAEWMWGRVNGK